MSTYIWPNGTVSVTLSATQKIAVSTQGEVNVYRTSGYVNYPDSTALLGTVENGQTVFGTYTGGAVLTLEVGGGYPAYYEIGTDPIVKEGRSSNGVQVTPTAETTAATLTAAELLTGLVTVTHAAGATQAYTLPTGTLLDAASTFAVNEYFDWTVINLSAAAADTATITAGADHTVVGTMICQSAHSTTGAIHGNALRLRTRKTAANTFVTYRLG
jgi:hypothetical protein